MAVLITGYTILGGGINVQDITLRVQRAFGDEAAVQIDQTDILRWINDAQEEIVINNSGLMETISTADVVRGQKDYIFPPDLAVMRSLQYKGSRVKYLSLNDFNEYLNGWNSPTSIFGQGTPEVFMTWDNKITVFPIPSESVTDGFSIFYMRHPIQVVSPTDIPEVPVQYHKAIVDYCLQQAYELDEDFEKKIAKDQDFSKRVMQLSNRNERVDEYYPRITVLPDWN